MPSVFPSFIFGIHPVDLFLATGSAVDCGAVGESE